MKYITKRIPVTLLLLISFFTTSCMDSSIAIEKKIEKKAEKIMDAIIAEDDKDLLEFFCSDIQDHRKAMTLLEIQKAFEFIDGKIVSYDYQQGGVEIGRRHGNIDLYSCLFDFTNVVTDTGNIYTIYIDYFYIWDEWPDREGICQIEIYKNDDRDNKIFVGKTNFDDWN